MALADGWPLNDPFGSWVYWNRIPAAAIDRLEVVRGAEGDLYGADALGGVIQVLTFDPSRPRLRAVVDGGSLDTLRGSVFGGGRFDGWTLRGAAEWQATDGAVVVSEADRGAVDVPADSDHRSAFLAAGHARGPWHATIHGHAAAEDRGNGTPLQVNDTRWSQVSGDAGGPGAGGIWRARITAGSQRYFQTFSAVADDRNSERLTTDQRVPTDFATAEGQWVRGWGPHALLAGAEYRRTDSEVHETRYAATGAVSGASIVQGTERIASVFARTRLALADTVDVVVGARGDWWESARSVDFFSPRASVIWRPTAAVQVQASASRAYRTPTLNELYRGFRVGAVLTNPNPLLAPERLTGVEGGLLAAWRRASVRVTAFRNVLDGAIANITIGPNLRERQNADRVGASGAELEMDLRLREGITLSSFAAFTSSRFERTPKQPAIEGNRVPQVPRYHIGFGVIAVAPRVATVSAQVRLAGAQFEDDLNELLLRSYTQVDASATRTLGRGVQAFVGVENLFDVEYDVGRTPVRTIGWPRTVRAGVRIFVP
jgi:outer membrane receptor protein involved in Fe transport